MKWASRDGDQKRNSRALLPLAVAAPGFPEYWTLMYGRLPTFYAGEFVAAQEAAANIFKAQVAGGWITWSARASCLADQTRSRVQVHGEFEALLANWDEDRDRRFRAVTKPKLLCVG
jgi:hypothetical protein